MGVLWRLSAAHLVLLVRIEAKVRDSLITNKASPYFKEWDVNKGFGLHSLLFFLFKHHRIMQGSKWIPQLGLRWITAINNSRIPLYLTEFTHKLQI